MWQAVLGSGQLVVGVLITFAVFMAALLAVEHNAKKRRRTARPALRVARCGKPNKAA